MLRNLTKFGLVCGLAVGFAACGDDEDPKSNNMTTPTTNNMTTPTNNMTTPTNNMTTPTNNMTTPTNNTTTQCTAVGQDCVVGEATAAGYVCADPGDGAKCASACTPPVDEDAQYPCPSGQACGALTQGGPTFCIVSQCNGWNDSASCDRFGYPNGGTCLGAVNNAFICQPAGTAAKGDTCANDAACGSGLFCLDGACANVCSNDAGCEGEERCLGDTDPEFLAANTGLCVVGCDTYSRGQCPQGEGCFPLLAEDGLCTAVGTVGPYEVCPTGGNTPACGEGLLCVTEGAMATSGICYPVCGGGLETQELANATCPGTGDFCVEAFDRDPWANGYCLEGCGPDDYGNDVCTGDTSCNPIRGTQHVCLDGAPGAVEAGGACDPEGVTSSCVETAFCEENGAGGGTCRNWCDLRAEADRNPALVCGQGEVCEPLGDEDFAFGRCSIPCDPSGYADTTACPANLQTCRPSETNVGVCEASGAVALGAACTDIFTSECVAGATCRNLVNLGSGGQAQLAAPGVCRNICDPFNPTCGTGEACVVDWLYLDREIGFCEPLGQPAPTPTSYAPCQTADTACGERAICLDFPQGGPTCVYLCDADLGAAPGNCPGTQRCVTSFTNPDTGETEPLGFGDYGLCQP